MQHVDLLELIGRDVHLRRKGNAHGGEYCGPCPFCGEGDDRFLVWPKEGRYWCRICHRDGDDIQYVRERDHVGYLDALKILGLEVPRPETDKHERKRPETAVLRAPNPLWQGRGVEFVATAAATLWQSTGALALAWLRQRCLTDETIRAAQVGYNEADRWEDPALWGLPANHDKVWLPRGVVIPWWIRGELWRINIRRPSGSPKYIGPAGWSTSLYNADAVRPDRPVVLVEGEIDALTVRQSVQDVAVPVATGSTSGSRHPFWVGSLALAPLVLVAYDCDEGGEKGSDYWLQKLSLARRWRPLWDDVNQMAQDGADIRKWVISGIHHHDARLAYQLAREWAGPHPVPVNIKLEELADYLEANQLKIVGGDPDLHGKPWRPHIILAPRQPLEEASEASESRLGVDISCEANLTK